MSSHVLDENQSSVLSCLQEGGNCSIAANPGTGKTTTILSIAAAMPHLKFLIITYNNALQADTSKSITERQITNVDVYTYHQFLHSKYDPEVCDDCGLMKVLAQDRHFQLQRPRNKPRGVMTMQDVLRNVKPLDELPFGSFMTYDVIVIDEIQDMSRPYFLTAVLAFIDNQRRRFQLIVMGDSRQVIYEYRGADKRYLTMAEKVFGNYPRLMRPGAWKKIVFYKTYRLSPSVCWFINEAMYHDPEENNQLISSESPETSERNHPVTVFIDDAMECLKMVMNTINQIFRAKPDCPKEEIVICCFSLADPFVKQVMQLLTLNGFPIFVPSGLEGANDASMYKGRIRFYTRHSVKGLTCDYLIQLNMNNTFYTIQQYNNPMVTEREMQRHITPPPHFVSLSRARVLLILINVYSPREHRSKPSKREDQIFGPYLKKQIWIDALEGKIDDLRIYGKHAEMCLSDTLYLHGKRVLEDEEEEETQTEEDEEESRSSKRRRKNDDSSYIPELTTSPSSKVFKKFDVTRLCAFLSSDFIARELWDIYAWFDKQSLSALAASLSTASSSSLAGFLGGGREDDVDDEKEVQLQPFKEITEEDMPSKVLNVYKQLEDVSDLTGKAMAFFGYDYLRERGLKKYFQEESRKRGGSSEFMQENGGLDFVLRQASFEKSIVGGDSYLTDFGNEANRAKHVEIRSRFNQVQTKPRESIRDYVHSVAVLEAVQSGMYHRLLHFKEEDMNWIPQTATESCKRVIDHFIPKSEDADGFLCEYSLSTKLFDVVPNVDVMIYGKADLISKRFLFEWKYKIALQLEDLLQLIIYMFLYRKVKGDMATYHKKFALLNIRTGVMYTLKTSHYERAFEMVEKLVYFKLTNTFKEDEISSLSLNNNNHHPDDAENSEDDHEEEDEVVSVTSASGSAISDEVFLQMHSLAHLSFLPAPSTATDYTEREKDFQSDGMLDL